MRMPFGKYKGCYLTELPDDYLLWLAGLPDLKPALAGAVKLEASRRGFDLGDDEAPPKGQPRITEDVRKMAREMVSAGVRVMAQRHHPDSGGTHVAMVNVNAAAEWLRSLVA